MRHIGLGIVAALAVGCLVRAMSAPTPNDVVVLSRRASRDLSCSASADDVERLEAGGYRVRACGREVTYGCFTDESAHFICLQATITPQPKAQAHVESASALAGHIDPFADGESAVPWPDDEIETTPPAAAHTECAENPYGDPCD